MKIIDLDGHEYSGSAKQIVAALNETSLAAHAKTAKVFREESADRASMISGVDVRFDTDTNYLNDLSLAGLIKILED